MNDLDFSALLCSRLCHDLISPVGAIANGLEIMDDEDDDVMRAEVMTLLNQSAEVTSSKLKFFRLSFGSAGGFGEKVPLSEAQNAIRGLYRSGNIDLTWKSEVGGMDKDGMKVMLNMVLLAGESMIRGGTLLVEIEENLSVTDITISVQGAKIIFQDAVREALLGDISEDNMEAKTAPAFLAASIARRLGSKIDYIQHDDQNFVLHTSYKER